MYSDTKDDIVFKIAPVDTSHGSNFSSVNDPPPSYASTMGCAEFDQQYGSNTTVQNHHPVVYVDRNTNVLAYSNPACLYHEENRTSISDATAAPNATNANSLPNNRGVAGEPFTRYPPRTIESEFIGPAAIEGTNSKKSLKRKIEVYESKKR